MHPSHILRAASSATAQKAASTQFYAIGAGATALFGAAGIYFLNRTSAEDKDDHSNPSFDRGAPSALHSVILPNVNLPKELHEKYNKYGKEGY